MKIPENLEELKMARELIDLQCHAMIGSDLFLISQKIELLSIYQMLDSFYSKIIKSLQK